MDDLEAYEERFRRAGLPLLIEGWSAREDALPRAFPLLAIVLSGELLGALIVAFGLLAVGADVRWAWIQTAGHHVGPRDLGLTVELLRVSAMIAARRAAPDLRRAHRVPRAGA
jgi:hypothetical protein